MERTYSKLTAAYVMVSKSRDDTVLPKHEDISPLLGDRVRASGGAYVWYKPVKRADGSTELQPLGVHWTDNGLDYFINIVGSLSDE